MTSEIEKVIAADTEEGNAVEVVMKTAHALAIPVGGRSVTLLQIARAQIAALKAAGYAIVPVEPTGKMIEAMSAEYDSGWCYADTETVQKDWARDSYTAMLKAAAQDGEG